MKNIFYFTPILRFLVVPVYIEGEKVEADENRKEGNENEILCGI